MTGRTAVDLAAAFAECISTGDLDGLATLMTDDHHLDMFDSEHVRGRDANIDAHRSYCGAYPRYRIHPHAFNDLGGGVVEIVGHTSGSHLALSDDQEAALVMRWLCETRDDLVSAWRLRELER